MDIKSETARVYCSSHLPLMLGTVIVHIWAVKFFKFQSCDQNPKILVSRKMPDGYKL